MRREGATRSQAHAKRLQIRKNDYTIHNEPFPSYDVSAPEARERLVKATLLRKKPRE